MGIGESVKGRAKLGSRTKSQGLRGSEARECVAPDADSGLRGCGGTAEQGCYERGLNGVEQQGLVRGGIVLGPMSSVSARLFQSLEYRQAPTPSSG